MIIIEMEATSLVRSLLSLSVFFLCVNLRDFEPCSLLFSNSMLQVAVLVLDAVVEVIAS